MNTARTLSWIVAVIALWKIIAPFILGYSANATAMWNAVIVGLVVGVVAVWAALSDNQERNRWIGWLNAVLGAWTVVSPFVLGYSVLANALWNDVIAGVLIACLSGWAAITLGGQVARR